MKKIKGFFAVACAIIIVFGACSNPKNKKSLENADTTKKTSKAEAVQKSGIDLPESYKRIYELENDSSIEEQTWSGYYTGSFGKNKITIQLRGIYEDSIFGYSICAGNFSDLRGKIKGNKIWMYEEKEDEHNGIFEMTINDQIMEGKWNPYNPEKDLVKEFALKKREFKYDINAGQFAFASQRELTRKDVENMVPENLRIMVNEIYARYGYCFYKKDVRYHFEAQPWYMPITTYVGENVTELEWKNIGLITEYTKYYDESLDDFGR